MLTDRWSSTAIPLLAAFISGVIGAGYGGHLSSKQWRYEKTLDAYVELISIVDRALIFVSDLPINAEVSSSLAKEGMREDALRYVERSAPNRFYALLIQARAPAHSIEALQPHRSGQVWTWLGRLKDANSAALSGSATLVATGDTTQHRASQAEIEAIRREILVAQTEDTIDVAPFTIVTLASISTLPRSTNMEARIRQSAEPVLCPQARAWV